MLHGEHYGEDGGAESNGARRTVVTYYCAAIGNTLKPCSENRNVNAPAL